MDVILATASYDHTIRFWEALSGICIQTLQSSDSHINRLAISHDKKWLAVAGNPSLKLYDIQSKSNTPISQFDAHTGNITAVAFQANNRWIMTASEDCTIKIWDIRAPNVQRDYKLSSPVNDAIIHPNQGEIISGDQNGGVRVWDLSENQCMLEMYPEESTPIRSVTISPDASFICAANNKGNVYAWNTSNPAQVTHLKPWQKFNAHAKYISRCLISPDTKYMATCSADHTVKVWKTTTNPFTLEKTLVGHQRWVWDCAFSADSAYLISSSSDNSSILWDLSSGDAIRHYNGHQKAVVCCALSDFV